MAQIIGTLTGFGSATILTPIAICFVDIKLAIPMVAFFHLFANLFRLAFFYKHVRIHIGLWFGVPAILMGMLGALLSARLPSDWLQVALGLFLCSFVFVSMRKGSIPHLKPSNSTLLLSGMGSGTLAGLLGTGGPIRSAALLAWGLPKEVYLGVSAAIAASVDITRLPVYWAVGNFPQELWTVCIGLVVAAFLGTWIGRWCVQRVSQEHFIRIVLVLLAVMGVRFLWKGIDGII